MLAFAPPGGLLGWLILQPQPGRKEVLWLNQNFLDRIKNSVLKDCWREQRHSCTQSDREEAGEPFFSAGGPILLHCLTSTHTATPG